MQHDLKYHETRLGEAQLVGWCVCGGWTYESTNLHQEPMVRDFIEHLEQVKPYVMQARSYFTSEDAPF